MSVYVAIPCMDRVDTEFMKSLLMLEKPPKTAYAITVASLTYDARNTLAKAAMESDCDKVMWIDSDMVLEHDTISKLAYDIDEGAEFVTGLYFTRKNPVKPVIFKDLGFKTLDNGMKESYAGWYEDYPRNNIFEIKAAGFGVLMMTTNLLRKVYDEYGSPFTPIAGYGEDLSFCMRCGDMGIPMYCDPNVKAGHIGTTVVTQDTYDNHITL